MAVLQTSPPLSLALSHVKKLISFSRCDETLENSDIDMPQVDIKQESPYRASSRASRYFDTIYGGM